MAKKATVQNDVQHANRATNVVSLYQNLLKYHNYRSVTLVTLDFMESNVELFDKGFVSSKIDDTMSDKLSDLFFFNVDDYQFLIVGPLHRTEAITSNLLPSIRRLHAEIQQIIPRCTIGLKFATISNSRDMIGEDNFIEFISSLASQGSDAASDIDYNQNSGVVEALKIALIESTGEHAIHCERVKMYNEIVARVFGLAEEDVHKACVLGWLHDLGKIAIEDGILDKPTKLTNDEMRRMSDHSAIGYRIVKPIPGFEEISIGIRHHHERYDGTGYPDRLKGSEIPILSRIISVTDAFDAILSRRSYKEPQTLEYAVAELQRNSGTQFDPEVVDKFIDLLEMGAFSKILTNFYPEH